MLLSCVAFHHCCSEKSDVAGRQRSLSFPLKGLDIWHQSHHGTAEHMEVACTELGLEAKPSAQVAVPFPVQHVATWAEGFASLHMG